MIGRLAGTLLEKNPPQILVDVQGVGYEVDVPMSTFYNLPATGERRHAAHASASCARTRICCSASAPSSERGAFRAADQDLRRRRAHRAVGAVGPVASPSCAQAVTLQDTGAADQGAGHRQEDRRAPAARAEGQARRGRHARRSASTVRRRPPRHPAMRCWRSATASKEAVAAVKQLPDGVAVADGIKQALKLLAKA